LVIDLIRILYQITTLQSQVWARDTKPPRLWNYCIDWPAWYLAYWYCWENMSTYVLFY